MEFQWQVYCHFFSTQPDKFCFLIADQDSKKDQVDKEKILAKTEKNQEKIFALQDKLYADAKEGLIIILQARDAAGKDSTIRHVMGGINPQRHR